MANFSAVGKKSRNKGAKFELKIAKLLTKWSGIEIRRTPMSGGWTKTGDITPKNPEMMVKWPFAFELKNHETWLLSDLITGTRPNKIPAWWKQTVDDSKETWRMPILVFTRNLFPDLMMMDVDHFKLVFRGKNPVMVWDGKAIFLFEELLKEDFSTVAGRVREVLYNETT